MARTSLVLAFVVAALAFLIPKACDLLGLEAPRFLDLALYVPAVLLGIPSWLRTSSFARSWPVLLCIGLVWIGLLHVEATESQRGLLAAYSLTMVLPVAALVVENRLWWLCARIYVLVNVIALTLVIWLEYRTYHGQLVVTLVRFGLLMSEDGTLALANPGPVGGQFAFAAVLAFVCFLRAQGAQSQGRPGPSGGVYLCWTVFLSLGCFLTASRGAFVAWFAGMALLLFFGTKQVPQDKLRDLVAFSAMLLCVAVFLTMVGTFLPWGALRERTAGAGNQTLTTIGSRTEIWRYAFTAWWSNPEYRIHGAGTGSAMQLVGTIDNSAIPDAYGVLIRDPHSVFVDWILSFGIVGIVAGLSLLLAMFLKARELDVRYNNVNRQAILLCMLLFSATIVIHNTSWWLAAAVLILAMLSPSSSAGSRARWRTGEASPLGPHSHHQLELPAELKGCDPGIAPPSRIQP